MKIQTCYICDAPTGRCEEDSIYLEPQHEHQSSLGPLCEDCCDKILKDAEKDETHPLTAPDAALGMGA